MNFEGPKTTSPSAETPNETPPAWKPVALKGIPGSLGQVWTSGSAGDRRYGVHLTESHLNAQKTVHGGVLMTFIDHGLSVIVWEAAGRVPCSTIQLNIQFLAAVRPPAFVEIRGEILRRASRFIFARGILRVAGADVTEATGVWSVRPAAELA